ncbi:hypothetical protein CH35J_003092 [Colletotrichum higginsianum]|nr:hypothetical protein CH35J_003092 [Colletotrichum higginsianum]
MVGDDLSSYSPGTKLSPHTRLLFHQYFYILSEALFPPEFCQAQNPMKTVWFDYLLNDKAYFHVSLSMTATCLDFFEYKDHESPQAIAHMTTAFALVNQKLSGLESLSDATIALVSMLSCQESIRGDLEKYKIHLAGLDRMVQLRGGLHAFEQNMELFHKICRSDIQYALHTDCPAFYHHDVMPQRIMQEICRNPLHPDRPLAEIFSAAEPTIKDLVREIDSISVFLSNCGLQSKLTADEFQSMLSSLGYRLLRVRDQGYTCPGDLHGACLLGVMSFYTSLLLQFGRQRHLLYERISRRLKVSVRVLDLDSAHSQFLPTLLWLLMLGAISVFEKEDDPWLLPELARVSEQLMLKTWEDIHCELKRYLWIDSIHNGQGRRLWDKVQRYQADKMV